MIFIYISFPKQYHALNTAFRLFHSYAETQIFSVKSTMMIKMFGLLRKSSLTVKVFKFSVKSGLYYTIKKLFWKCHRKNLCMSLFSNNVAGLQPETSFEKGLCARVFQYVLPNILERLSCKTRPDDSSSKISLCLSRQHQSQNVTIDLVFSLLL